MDRSDLDPDPIAQFRRWLDEAAAAGLDEPAAMTMATATPDGRPSARAVLLQVVDDRGFVFYTNYGSRKACELDANPRAALVFLWHPLGRQVCVEGMAARVSAAESDAYFASRPREHQLGAWASDQSAVIASRDALDARYHAAAERYRDQPVPRPAHWGGFRVVPTAIEFWQSRAGRLHDRLRYRRVAGDGTSIGPWTIERLAP